MYDFFLEVRSSSGFTWCVRLYMNICCLIYSTMIPARRQYMYKSLPPVVAYDFEGN